MRAMMKMHFSLQTNFYVAKWVFGGAKLVSNGICLVNCFCECFSEDKIFIYRLKYVCNEFSSSLTMVNGLWMHLVDKLL